MCFFCNKEGHKSYMCRLKRKEEANKREGKQKKSVTPKAPYCHKGLGGLGDLAKLDIRFQVTKSSEEIHLVPKSSFCW